LASREVATRNGELKPVPYDENDRNKPNKTDSNKSGSVNDNHEVEAD
jgi:hypothetical protein